MYGYASALAAVFDGDKGYAFTAVLVCLMVGGVVMLLVNLSSRSKPPAQPAWEAVPEDAPAPPKKPQRRA